MKTEFEIAKENVKHLFYKKGNKWSISSQLVCLEHKVTCQRWLEFLEELRDELRGIASDEGLLLSLINEKITDLKNTIKLYSENGN